ncbi:MAG: calcium/sodium antiporter [Bacteroidales bacterium]|nr:calcium/sodium antiporter [Bacteroidales bacterium]
MVLNIIFIIVGIAIVLWGADRLTDGAVALAQKMNIPEIVIGLTIVAMGTSMPEFFVSLMSAINGTPDLAVGNVVGSNIFNSLLIVGVAAIVAPMVISKSTVKKDIPFAVLASALLFGLGLDNNISRIDALILSIVFVFFMIYTVRTGKQGSQENTNENSNKIENKEKQAKNQNTLSQFFKFLIGKEKEKLMPIWIAIILLLIGLACLIFGSNLFVNAATEVATALGVSQAIIGLTIVAGGTSLPELATSVVAAKKGQSAIAMGNVIGSNVMNILMILGITGLICPMQVNGITIVDLSILLLSAVLLWLFSYTKYTVQRWEGVVLCAIFGGYMAWLISSAI